MEPLSRRLAANTCRRCSKSSSSLLQRPNRSFSRAPISHSSTRTQLSAHRLAAASTAPKRPLSLFGGQPKLAQNESPASAPDSTQSTTPVLRSDDLFHSFTNSPIPEIRQRAAYIRQHAYCPHPDHRATRAPVEPNNPRMPQTSGDQAPAHVDFECPDCGVPVYCSENHWAEDYENHLQICDTLRQINEDDHDLRSGRFFPEFEYAGPQMEEALVNMTNWDTFLYTRQFEAINDDRSMRQVTRLLTYPLTIGSILHELSPYSIQKGGRLTPEGLKSLSALRYTLHPPKTGGGTGIKGLRPEAPPVRIFILGARAESSLPRNVWVQLAHLFPRGKFHLIFVGPESMTNRDDEFPLPPRTPSNPFGAVVEDRVWPTMKISTIVDYYHTLHKTGHFYPYDPYFDCFVLFHPGLGHPASSHEWAETVPLLLETKAPILVTGYTQHDMDRDIEWVNKTCRGEFDLLMEPGENTFRSLRWDLNDLDPQDINCGNWGVWAFRGKRSSAAPSTGDTNRETLDTKTTTAAAAATITTIPAGLSSPVLATQPNQRPPARLVSSDFLSDEATAALIRRTLCSRQWADRGRGSPPPIHDLLPPLTSRNDVDLQLYALISIILREFVQNWYNKITPDETFVAEIVQIIAHCTRALEQRLRNVDLESLLFDELPELLAAHVRAYRIASNPGTRPPLEVDLREAYHSLWPLPALSPVPKPGIPESAKAQAENEAAYRQLLVQGVLAVLLPTEDLENECLTSLVGQLLSELVIGNLVANKVSEPWLIWEGLIILSRLVGKKTGDDKSNHPSNELVDENSTSRNGGGKTWSVHLIFWSFVHWVFLIFGILRVAANAIALSWSLPPRSSASEVHQSDSWHLTVEKTKPASTSREVATDAQSTRVPLLDFYLWSCIGDLLEMDIRMPWLCGTASLMQWIAMKGPGGIAEYNGALDR
ncbi:PXA domain-containing protein [Xylariaceae sp. FL0255]|nr:PXA domain-containing protein [Xylariaceae sp. FL0255]